MFGTVANTPLYCIKKEVIFKRVVYVYYNVYNVLQKKDGLKNFAKFTGKHLCQSLLFNKFAD